MNHSKNTIQGEAPGDGFEVKPWCAAKPGEIWQVDYVNDLYARSGFSNESGLHEVYEANGGQRYFRRLTEDQSGGNLSITNELIDSAELVAVPADSSTIFVE